MNNDGRTTSEQLYIPSLLIVGGSQSLLLRCFHASKTLGLAIKACTPADATGIVARRHPLAIIVPNDVFAGAAYELSAVARDVRSALLPVDPEVSVREIEAMVAAAIDGGFHQRERRGGAGRYSIVDGLEEEAPFSRRTLPPPSPRPGLASTRPSLPPADALPASVRPSAPPVSARSLSLPAAPAVPGAPVSARSSSLPAVPGAPVSARSSSLPGAPVSARSSSLPAVSGAPVSARSSSLPAVSGAPVSARPSSLPAVPGAPVSARPSSLPAVPGAPVSARSSSLPAVSGAPVSARSSSLPGAPVSARSSSLPAVSGAPVSVRSLSIPAAPAVPGAPVSVRPSQVPGAPVSVRPSQVPGAPVSVRPAAGSEPPVSGGAPPEQEERTSVVPAYPRPSIASTARSETSRTEPSMQAVSAEDSVPPASGVQKVAVGAFAAIRSVFSTRRG